MKEAVRTDGRAATVQAVSRPVVAVAAGAVLVALGAQLSVPLPGTPVPLTFQVPAALIVGGLLGAPLGAAALALYLVMGAAGLPVFAPIGLPGLARLFGPTGGYLLALPLAAAIVGRAVRFPLAPARLALGLALGLLVVYAGGVAQLAVLSGDVGSALRMGSVPFLAGDAVKVLLVGLVVGRFAAPVRRALP